MADDSQHYVVHYFYVEHTTKKWIHHNWFIYPKMYNSIIDAKLKAKLDGQQGFVCNTSYKNGKKVQLAAFILNITPASAADLNKYKPLDFVKTMKAEDDQLAALKNFEKIKFNMK